MDIEEMSNGFSTLVNSYHRFKDFDRQEILDSIEFDEYEKSLYLTKSQDDLVLALYTGKNTFGDTFEGTEEMRRHLSSVVKEARLEPIVTSNGMPLGMESSSKFFTLPDDLWFITYECAAIADTSCESLTNQDVLPVKQDEYHKIKRDPFRGANGRRVLRLDLADNVIELVSKTPVASYYIRYIKLLSPIILEDLPPGLTIRHKSERTPCELHEGLHEKILEHAVMLALQSKGYNTKNENK